MSRCANPSCRRGHSFAPAKASPLYELPVKVAGVCCVKQNDLNKNPPIKPNRHTCQRLDMTPVGSAASTGIYKIMFYAFPNLMNVLATTACSKFQHNFFITKLA